MDSTYTEQTITDKDLFLFTIMTILRCKILSKL